MNKGTLISPLRVGVSPNKYCLIVAVMCADKEHVSSITTGCNLFMTKNQIFFRDTYKDPGVYFKVLNFTGVNLITEGFN